MLSRVDKDGRTFSLEQGMREYDAEVFERGRREIEVSFQQSYASTHWDAYLESASVKQSHRPIPRVQGDRLEE